MSTLLYVRTAIGGTGPDVPLADLGVIIATSATWTLLSASSVNQALGSSGQFSARELRDSQNLFDAIVTNTTLEWSRDGVSVALSNEYTADYQIVEDFTDDSFRFINLQVSGQFLLSGFDVNTHFDGGPNKHDASEIDVEGTYSNIPGTPGNLEITISGINTTLGTITDHSGLTGLGDDDHTQYLLLSGLAARNAVTGEIDITGGDLRLPVDVSPPAGNAGSVTVIGGLLYVYDTTRAKYLSVDRKLLWASRNAASSNNIYLRGPDGTPTSATGFRMPRNGTITALTLALEAADTVTLEIRKNDSVTVIASLVNTAVAGSQSNTINVDFVAGDELQVFINGNCRFPTAGLEIAWRV